jgi:hypothetical protein
MHNNEMQRPKRWRIAGAVVLTGAFASTATAVCVDWSGSKAFAELMTISQVVFEGTVQQIEEDTSAVCAPDRVVFSVSRVWKGPEETRHILRQTTLRTHQTVIDGRVAIAGCPLWVEQDSFDVGQRYIVFAGGTPGQLESMGCGLSSPPTPEMRKRLDRWLRKQGRRSLNGGPTKR